MKKTTIICLAFSTFVACTQTVDYKITRQEVIDLHDKLMLDGEIAIKNKMKLDTLLKEGFKKQKNLDTLKEKAEIVGIITSLNKADENMMNWMHQFNAEVGDKNNQQAVDYFNNEKRKLIQMDSLYKTALKKADIYLKKNNIK